jgi:hypothetical protein
MDNNTTPQTTAELLARIDESWRAFDQAVGHLSPEQRIQLRDRNGWSVKDHLAHVWAWEQSLLALLEGRDRNAAIGVPSGDDQDIDAINELIRQQRQPMSLAAVQQALHESHAAVVAAIARLSDADLFKPYAAYQPTAPEIVDPVIGWIISNTYEHYVEHTAWIQALAAQ